MTGCALAVRGISAYVSVAIALVSDKSFGTTPTSVIFGVIPTLKETILGAYAKPTPEETLPAFQEMTRVSGL